MTMIKITLPDQSELQFEPPVTGLAVAEKIGKSLAKAQEWLNRLDNQPKFAPDELATDFMQDLVFVTYSSSNHFRESYDAIATTQFMFPNHTIYYYDLGLKASQIIEVGY